MAERHCGDCYACCVVLGIEALKKWHGQACRHLDGRNPQGRCGIYPQRPVACSRYGCGWLAGLGQDNDRPNQSGVLITLYSLTSATVHITDPAKAGDFKDPDSAVQRLLRMLVEVGVDDIHLLPKGSRVDAPVLHLLKGNIYQGKMLASRSYEELNYAMDEHPIGRYELHPRSDNVSTLDQRAQG